jgi:hypothetical protein
MPSGSPDFARSRTWKPRCSSLIPSAYRLDYISWSRLAFRENKRAFRLTLSENRPGFAENSLIISGAAGII